ncbi:MAG: site-2 protease family protein [Ruminococcaceae bacterium]|nr:site-2 protease family protein [Oscillospiraceae bacterium]
MYILFAILAFGILIFVHELGHFIAAKSLGVKVNEFAICMGPAIFQKTVGETTYSLRSIPIGGYCAMEGEDEASDSPRAFTSAKWWKRLIILAAGAFMNFVIGFLIVLLLFSTADGFSTTQVSKFLPDSPMEVHGMQEGDYFYSIDGSRVYTLTDIQLYLSRNATGKCDLVVLRDGEKVEMPDFTLEKKEYETEKGKELLYGFTVGYEEATASSVLRNSWYACMDFCRMVWMGLEDLITGRAGLNEVGGPVAIVNTMSETGKAAKTTAEGIRDVLYLTAFIAVNLAVMNMLPIPALDGGRIFFLLVTAAIEGIFRKKIDPKYEGYIHGAGMVLLLLFMAFITFHDVWKLIFR